MRIQTKKQIVNDDENDPPADFTLTPRKVALVAADATATRGYEPYLSRIAATADAEGCDTILYAPAPRGMPPIQRPKLFGRARAVTTIFLEVTASAGDAVIEVWRKAARTPHRFRQRLARSQERVAHKRALMQGLPARTFGSTMFLACGEANIVSTKRSSTATVDPFGFLPSLMGRKLILNPSHTYMSRHEMREKRRRYSQGGRVVLSVWNPGHEHRDAEVPWQAFANGREVTERVRRVLFPEPKIHIGVFKLE